MVLHRLDSHTLASHFIFESKEWVMLEYSREFIVLADCLSYVKAARELNVSQPSLTRHIAYLEKELGFRLFNRNPLSLTPAGQFYLEFIGEIIERLDEGIEQGRSIASGNQTRLTIFMFPGNSTFANIVHEAIAAMRTELPFFSPHVQFENRR